MATRPHHPRRGQGLAPTPLQALAGLPRGNAAGGKIKNTLLGKATKPAAVSKHIWVLSQRNAYAGGEEATAFGEVDRGARGKHAPVARAPREGTHGPG